MTIISTRFDTDNDGSLLLECNDINDSVTIQIEDREVIMPLRELDRAIRQMMAMIQAINDIPQEPDQGEYCDKHYWQDQAKKATLAEREANAIICETEGSRNDGITCAELIRERK